MQDIFRSLRHRMNWTHARKILKLSGIPTGQGWDATLEKINQLGGAPENGRLHDAMIEHILCGQKFTKLYPISAGDRVAIEAAISSCSIANCPASSSYPLVMTDEDLLNGTGDIEVVNIISNDDGFGLILSSVYWVRKREDISFQEFEHPSIMQRRYDEIVGIVRTPVQLFHVVWLPHHRNFLEVRTDTPRGLPDADIHGIHSVLKSRINTWNNVHLGRSVNLFPAVRPFYDDVNEGTVSQMTFQTTTGGIKDEKLPRRVRDADQRTEAYHVAGKGAVEAIRIYRITVEWAFKEADIAFLPSVSLSASGPSGNGENGNPVISGALIENCLRAADYEFVIERLGRKAQLDLTTG